jgi:hypothetical protein
MQNNPLSLTRNTKPKSTTPKSATPPAFPSPRYFQVHFDYLHELLSDMKKQLDNANEQITTLQRRLDHVVPPTLEILETEQQQSEIF